MKIVYCGAFWEGGTCRMRGRALERLGHEVVVVDTATSVGPVARILSRASRATGWWRDHSGANERLLDAVKNHLPDWVWIDNGQAIRRQTLREIRKRRPIVRILHYSPDDMVAQHNQSVQYRQCIPEYDLHATTKSYNVQELRALGARAIAFVNNAYCPETHRPMEVTPQRRHELGGPVGFIGAFEEKRALSILALAADGIPVRVWGGSNWARQWMHSRYRHKNLIIESRGVFGREYAEAICSFDINLGFLRKINRDLQTTRSVEVPACGAFLLAERTEEHRSLFEEGVEAEYFDSDEELVAKCRFYLKNKQQRQLIACNARRRCLYSNYSYDGHVEEIIHYLQQV